MSWLGASAVADLLAAAEEISGIRPLPSQTRVGNGVLTAAIAHELAAGPQPIAALAKRLGRTQRATSCVLWRLMRDGLVERAERAVYRLKANDSAVVSVVWPIPPMGGGSA